MATETLINSPAKKVMWQAILYTPSYQEEEGIPCGIPELLPELYATSCEAMDAAVAMMDKRPDVYQSTARRVVVSTPNDYKEQVAA